MKKIDLKSCGVEAMSGAELKKTQGGGVVQVAIVVACFVAGYLSVKYIDSKY